MIEKILHTIRETYPLEERELGEFRAINKKGMHFEIHAYTVKGIGNLSTLKMHAMLGLMKMETVVWTPLSVDAPLHSFDRILAMGKDTLLLELYDTQLQPWEKKALDAMNDIKERYSNIPDHDLGKHWYDPIKLSPSLSKRGKKLGAFYEKLTEEYLRQYITQLQNAPACSVEEKCQKTAAYVDGLFENGGPSTDQFIKLIGKEKAKELFARYIFASAE